MAPGSVRQWRRLLPALRIRSARMQWQGLRAIASWSLPVLSSVRRVNVWRGWREAPAGGSRRILRAGAAGVGGVVGARYYETSWASALMIVGLTCPGLTPQCRRTR